MSTFNPSDGSVTGTTSDGSFIWAPPFTSQTQINGYMDALQGVSSLKKTGIISTGNLSESATLSSVAASNELPAVQVYKIDTNPPIFAVVYTDSNGVSSFSYKNDPTNRITLVQNGSRINPIVSAASPTTGTVQQTSVDTVKQTYATSSTQESSGGILGAICWCLSCMSSIGFISLIGFLVYMALKKP